MKLSRLLMFAALLFPVFASAQFAPAGQPEISAITPPSGPPGTVVTITGKGFDLPPGFACFAPCPARVLFNTADAVVREASDKELVVIAPPQPAGVAVLTIVTGDARITFSTFTFTDSLEAQYESVLLPIYLDGRTGGANGSQWQTDFWIRNNAFDGVALAPWVCPTDQVCPAVIPLTRTLQGFESLHNLPAFSRPPTSNPGRILYVTRGSKISASLRVADVSRQSLNAGTQIPVVRTAEFAKSAVQLLNVPAGTEFRDMLRVYDLMPTPTLFRVNLYRQAEGATGAPFATFELKTVPAQSGEFRDLPGYTQVDLQSYVGSQTGSYRVEVIPQTPGSQFWTFVSITNNDTQLVTLSTP